MRGLPARPDGLAREHYRHALMDGEAVTLIHEGTPPMHSTSTRSATTPKVPAPGTPRSTGILKLPDYRDAAARLVTWPTTGSP